MLIALKDKLPDGGSLVKKAAAILTCNLETEDTWLHSWRQKWLLSLVVAM